MLTGSPQITFDDTKRDLDTFVALAETLGFYCQVATAKTYDRSMHGTTLVQNDTLFLLLSRERPPEPEDTGDRVYVLSQGSR